MFLRIVKAAGGAGVQHEYVRLVEAYREDGKKKKQRVICNLGRKDVLGAHLDALIRLLRGEAHCEPVDGDSSPDVSATGAWDWGPTPVAWKLWRELWLAQLLGLLGGPAAPART